MSMGWHSPRGGFDHKVLGGSECFSESKTLKYTKICKFDTPKIYQKSNFAQIYAKTFFVLFQDVQKF